MDFGRMGAGFGERLGGVRFDTSAQAIFAAFSTPPAAARKSLINAAVLSLKNAGLWSKLDVLYVLAAADSQAATINWINTATFALSPTNSPTFTTDRGYTGNGSTSYLETGYNPATNGVGFTQNSAHVGYWSLTDHATGESDIGNSGIFLSPKGFGNFFAVVNDTGGTLTALTNTSGHILGSRIGSTTASGYYNGASSGSTGAGSQAVGSETIAICKRTTVGQHSTKQFAAAHLGAGLTSGDAAAFYAVLLTYLQGVGAA